jgi:hypothetical protein
MTELGEFGMWLAIGAGQVAFWIAISPLIRSAADRIRAKGGVSAEIDARLAALESRSPITGESDAVQQRVLELEERVDFTERVLTRPREPERLS